MACLGATGRIPTGAQARLGVLMRPKRLSSCAIFKKGRWSSAGRVATAASMVAAKFFKLRLGFCIGLQVDGVNFEIKLLISWQLSC